MDAGTIASETPATTVGTVRHPVARRVADVLRRGSGGSGVFVVDDVENIAQALRCGIGLDSLYVTESLAGCALPQLAGVDRRVPRHVLDDDVARSLFGEQKRSRVFALARTPPASRLRGLAGATGDIVVLDGVRLVGNIGAIVRTACALGAAGVVLLDSGLRTPLDRRLVRASRGLVFATPVVLATRAQLLEFVRREGLPIATLSADAARPLSAIGAVGMRLALVLGGERRGVSSELDSLAGRRYAIPMGRDVESLNVSVAAAIALYARGVG
jgi:TrmH family RNA methyltransferase